MMSFFKRMKKILKMYEIILDRLLDNRKWHFAWQIGIWFRDCDAMLQRQGWDFGEGREILKDEMSNYR